MVGGAHPTKESMEVNLRHKIGYILLSVIALAIGIGGCAIPQPPGHGSQFLMQEPQAKRNYYLYLPTGYTPNRAWPLVVTFHGMRPFDSAPAQAKEWQNVADRYGYIVVAPDLINSDLFMQYPLRSVSGTVTKDEQNVTNVIQYVIDHCNIDRNRIYATSWSSGGYLMHYYVNRHPDMFSAMCARGSCFSEPILDSGNAQKMSTRHFPILIYYCENDLPGIQKESEQAIGWYQGNGFKVTSRVVPGKGHERVPDLAAEFFALTSISEAPAQAHSPSPEQQSRVDKADRVEVETNSSVGVTPFTLNLLANLPGIPLGEYRSYKFSWYIDDKLQDQAQGSGKRMLYATLYTVGDHVIKVQVITPGSRTLEKSIPIRVLPSTPKL
jgi:poly(3-hydroxybutyrate) depolymerase